MVVNPLCRRGNVFALGVFLGIVNGPISFNSGSNTRDPNRHMSKDGATKGFAYRFHLWSNPRSIHLTEDQSGWWQEVRLKLPIQAKY
jgi:hypothetical protein